MSAQQTDQSMVAISTYGKEMMLDPATGVRVSSLKCTLGIAPVLLTLFGSQVRDITPRRASYRYLVFEPKLDSLEHNWLLIWLNAAQMKVVGTLTRRTVFPRIYRWQQDHWSEFPSRDYPDFRDVRTFSTAASPRFTPYPHMVQRLPVPLHTPAAWTPQAPVTVDATAVATVAQAPAPAPAPAPAATATAVTPAASAEQAAGRQQALVQVERSGDWWWLSGDTYPHRELLRAAGAHWSKRRRQWYVTAPTLPAAIAILCAPPAVGATEAPPSMVTRSDEASSTTSGLTTVHGIGSTQAAVTAVSEGSKHQLEIGTVAPEVSYGVPQAAQQAAPLAVPSAQLMVMPVSPSPTSATAQADVPEQVGNTVGSAIRVIPPSSIPAQALTAAAAGAAATAAISGTMVPSDYTSTLISKEGQAELEPAASSPFAAEQANDSAVSATESDAVADLTLTGPLSIRQHYVGEVTGSISGNVHCYGYAVHQGICVYLNMGGPRTAVEAIRAKLSKGEMVNVVPWDAPAIELSAGEGQTGKYTAYLANVPEARFTSVILVHEWITTPDFRSDPTTFLFRVNEQQAMAKLRLLVTELVNVPVFESWADYLWRAGHRAGLIRPTESGQTVDLLTLTLDRDAWTNLIAAGLAGAHLSLPSANC